MENQIKKNVENEMENRCIKDFIGINQKNTDQDHLEVFLRCTSIIMAGI